MAGGRADAVQPHPLVAIARYGEGGAGDPFGIQAIGHALGGILPHRQRARQRFGCEFIAETR